VAHPLRAGSRLRIEVNTAGGDAPAWSFQSPDYGATTHDVGWGGLRPSSVVLPVLPASGIPEVFAGQASRPACNWLRAQPCRTYHRLVNQTVAVEEPPAPAPTSAPTTSPTTVTTYPSTEPQTVPSFTG